MPTTEPRSRIDHWIESNAIEKVQSEPGVHNLWAGELEARTLWFGRYIVWDEFPVQVIDTVTRELWWLSEEDGWMRGSKESSPETWV